MGSSFDRSYGVTYQIGLDKTYHVQPKHGEIDYEMAAKDPQRLYNKIVKEPIQQHEVKKSQNRRPRAIRSTSFTQNASTKVSSKSGMQYSVQKTKRAISVLLQDVHQALRLLLCDVTKYSPEQIDEALKHQDSECVLKQRISQGQIRLLDKDSNEPLS